MREGLSVLRVERTPVKCWIWRKSIDIKIHLACVNWWWRTNISKHSIKPIENVLSRTYSVHSFVHNYFKCHKSMNSFDSRFTILIPGLKLYLIIDSPTRKGSNRKNWSLRSEFHAPRQSGAIRLWDYLYIFWLRSWIALRVTYSERWDKQIRSVLISVVKVLIRKLIYLKLIIVRASHRLLTYYFYVECYCFLIVLSVMYKGGYVYLISFSVVLIYFRKRNIQI